MVHALYYDEKPGISAVANIYPDHNPAEENGFVRRDYECVHLEPLSLLKGEAVPLVRKSHKSADFIEFLKMLVTKYLEGDTICLILDNHLSHRF